MPYHGDSGKVIVFSYILNLRLPLKGGIARKVVDGSAFAFAYMLHLHLLLRGKTTQKMVDGSQSREGGEMLGGGMLEFGRLGSGTGGESGTALSEELNTKLAAVELAAEMRAGQLGTERVKLGSQAGSVVSDMGFYRSTTLSFFWPSAP